MNSLLDILQHALGTDQYGRGSQERNYFVTGDGARDHETCMAAVEVGLMTRHEGGVITGGGDVFVVTPAGKCYVRHNSPKPPKRTPGQRRYQAYLDADSGLTFGQWLKRGGNSACNA